MRTRNNTMHARIEAVREFFELADNWPTEPFLLPPPGAGFVPDPRRFVHGHMDIVLSGKKPLLVPYLERLEFLILYLKKKTRS